MISLRRVPELWQRLDVTLRDLPLGLMILIGSLIPALQSNGTELGTVPDRPYDALAVAAVALECLPLALRRRWPTLCLTLVSIGFAIDQLAGYHSFSGTALPVALVSLGAHLERHRRLTALGFALAYIPLAVALSRLGTGETLAGFAMFFLVLVLMWGIGSWLRSTRVAEAERRRRVAEDTRLAERTRIARELHDVVTHHVTAMVVQAEAARYLTAAPDRLDETLTTVAGTGRRAVTDLRHLLDLLNPEHDDQTPSTARLDELVDSTRQSGQPVEFTVESTPAEPTGSADLVTRRLVQESLTNALKYAHGNRTVVQVRHTEKEITVEVGTDGPGPTVAATGGSGRGLVGLRERVDVLGGDFHAGAREDGGFVVRARIPAARSQS